MKNLIIAILFLLPFTVSAQLLRSYGVVEIGTTFPTSTSTGAKYAYRPVDSSFYRWVSGSTWVKVVNPSINPLYLKQVSGTTSKFSGDTINLIPYLLKTDTTSMLSSYINLAGWGLSKLTKTLQVDSSKVATRFYVQNIFLAKADTAAMLAKYIERGDTASMLANYPSTAGYGIIDGGKTWRADTTSPNGLATRLFAKTLPTTIGTGQIAYSNGSNLVGTPNFIWDNPNRRIGMGTTPTIDIDIRTTTNTPVGIQMINSDGGNNSYSYLLFRASSTAGRLAVIGKMGDGVPPAQTRNAGDFYLYNGANFGDIVLHNDYPSGRIKFTGGASSTTHMMLNSNGYLNLGTSATPSYIFDINSTDAIRLPRGTDAQRPTNAFGLIRGSLSSNFIEAGLGSTWENIITSTGASANQVPYFTSAGQIVGNTGHTVDVGTKSQLITFNNSGGAASWYLNASTPISSGGPFGFVYYNNNQIRFGLQSGANINWIGGGAQASLQGTWSFPSGAAYPSPLLASSSSGSGNDVRWAIGRSGTGANQVIYAYTQRYATNDQAPHLNFGATSYVFGTRNTTTAWNTAADTTTGYIAQNGDFWLGRRSPSNAYWNPPTTQARLNVVGRGTATTYPLLLLENLGGTDRFSVLENGEVRIPTLAATPTRIVGADGDGDLGAISLSSDVTISSGTLGIKNIGNTDLALTGNRTLHGGGNTLRLHANTVVRDSLKVANLADHAAPDSIVTTEGGWLGKKKFLKDAANYFDGTTEGFYFDGDVIGYDVVSGSNYAGTYIEPEYYETTTYNSAGDYSSVFGRLDGMNTYAMMEVSYLTNNGQLYLDVDDGAVIYWGSGGAGNTFQSLPNGTQRFHKYGVGNKEAADVSKTQSNYISSFATDGTLLDLNLGTGLSLSGGSLTAQNIFNTDGTFTGSRTVDAAGYALRFNNISSLGLAASNHTSEIGNATLFQRKKLTASESKYYDAHYQYDSRSSISNGTNVAAGPSYSRLFVYNLGGGEGYEWTDMHTLDTTNSVFGHMYGARYSPGLSAFRAIRPSSGSAYRLTPAFDFYLEAGGNGASGANVLDVRVGNDTLFSVKQNGTVELDGYGAGTINSTTLGTYPTSVAGITANGTLTNYRFARDTFIEDVTLFSVGTLLYDCQELTIVSSMTSFAATNQEIRFPDAADHLRGKKIIVYSKKKDAGSYVPYISVVGGVSRLFYTTNPAVGGTDPSSQATLYIDDSTWSDHGTTFEFTCLKIDNTPSYRWVLNQR